MKILIVCSKNSGKIAPFIVEQVEALEKLGIMFDYFTIEQKGWRGYLKSRKLLLEKIKSLAPNIIHAHFGLSGLLANLQRKIPVVTTYHGSDINVDSVFFFSQIAILFSKFNIFVSQKNIDKAKISKNFALIPCGVDTELFCPMHKQDCQAKLSLDPTKKHILFAGAFDNEVKNATLAQSAVAMLRDEATLIELKGYKREEVVELMNAVDICLMTSRSEGSPQFIKEAMACGCPIVSVDVGDVKELIQDVQGCYICETYSAKEIANNLQKALEYGKKTEGQKRISELGIDQQKVSESISNIYEKLCMELKK